MTVNVSINPLGYTGISPAIQPGFYTNNGAPNSGIIYPGGTRIMDISVNPPVIYETTDGGRWVAVVSPSLTPTATGVSVAGNLSLTNSATEVRIKGGAATDFIGSGTLVAGTLAIANTNIAATDRIFIQRSAANASATLGELTYTISAGVSFTVTSVILATPASTQTADVSTFSYVIFRQL